MNYNINKVDKQAFKQFLVVRSGLKPNSVRHALSRFNVFTTWLKSHQKELSRASVDEFIYKLSSEGRNNNTLNTYVFFINKLYEFCQYQKIETDDFRIDSFKKIEPTIYVLTVKEIQDLINCELEYGSYRGLDCSRLNPLYATITALLATTGMRIEEALDLEIRHIDFGNKVAHIEESKNGEVGLVYLNNDVIEMLKGQIGNREDGAVFLSMNGDRLATNNYRDALRDRAKKCGIKKRVYPHLFRHTFATLLHNKGLTLVEIMALTRHKDIKSLTRYIHMANDKNRTNAMKHPLNQASMDTSELLADDLDELKSLKSLNDPRMEYTLSTNRDGFVLKVKKKKPLNLQTSNKFPTQKY